jgi:hypothetical protein
MKTGLSQRVFWFLRVFIAGREKSGIQAERKPAAPARSGSYFFRMRRSRTFIRARKTLLVEGHTDNVPIRSGRYHTNWELSMARAYSVIQFMEQAGIEPRKLAGIGYGENRPASENTSAEGRAKNRRIEISLLKTE